MSVETNTGRESVLVVEDDSVLNQLIVDQLERTGHGTRGVTTWREAEKYLRTHEPALVLLDIRLPDANSEKFLAALSGHYQVIVITAYGSLQSAVKAMRAGAADYLMKPVNLEQLELSVHRALQTAALRREHQFWKQQSRIDKGETIVGSSLALREVVDLVDAVAPTNLTVLIQGESGVGKELVACAIHKNSSRVDGNFVAVDCCTIAESLFESELFGHERGAFTGADRQKRGLVEGAEGGTLFLDEIGEVEPSVQSKLLRLLDVGEFRRVGGTKDLRADVRVVAATNRNLVQMVSEGCFRSDLLYRLNAFVITVPPLRDRREDIPDLAEHFVRNHAISARVSKKISKSALKRLLEYDWPGNVRELRNVMERAIILSGSNDIIVPMHLRLAPASSDSMGSTVLEFDEEPTLKDIEKEYLRRLLVKYCGHRATVARILGVSERNLYRLIRKHELS